MVFEYPKSTCECWEANVNQVVICPSSNAKTFLDEHHMYICIMYVVHICSDVRRKKPESISKFK